MNRILVVDDESDICAILKYNLEKQGYAVDTADSAESATLLDLSSYDLFILDVMMGGKSGCEFAADLKKSCSTASVPVIFISAKDTEDDIAEGFSTGADDYISKPFSVLEVICRVKAVLRRCKKEKQDMIVFDTLSVDTKIKKVFVDDTEIPMTKTEFGILHMLVRHPGMLFSREEILGAVRDDNVCVSDRTVDVNITRLRHKLGKYGHCIVTRHGYGYSFEHV